MLQKWTTTCYCITMFWVYCSGANYGAQHKRNSHLTISHGGFKCGLQYSDFTRSSFGWIQTYLPLSHQLPLRCRSSFDQSTSGSSNGLGCLQDLLLKVQALICLLFTREGNQQSINTLCYRAAMIYSHKKAPSLK